MASEKTTSTKATPQKAPSTKKAAAKKPAASKSAAKNAPPVKGAKKMMNALDAAAKVLGASKKPMRCQELIAQMAAKRYWTSPGGKTPAATLYSAMTGEINAKGKDARFQKVDRGLFARNG